MMQIEEYFECYDAFDAEFFPMAMRDDVLNKLDDEMCELQSEIDRFETELENRENLTNELVDVMNTAIKTLRTFGIDDPLQAGADKLALTAEKYRNERAAE